MIESKIATEISVIVKDENSKLTEKELCYDRISISDQDPKIYEIIQRALDKFGRHEAAPDIIVKTTTVFQ